MNKKVVKKAKKNTNNKTIKTIILSVFTIIILGGLLFLTFKELWTEKDIKNNNEILVSDSDKFEKEFESLNDVLVAEDRTYLSININNPNPIKYIDGKSLIEKIDNKETFLVYFGYAKCPWCRTVIENMLSQAKEYNIENIYYLNIEDIRDEYILNENNELFLNKEATEEYKVLLEKLDALLDVYQPLEYLNAKGETIVVPINEKRIYGPTLMFIKEGIPTLKTTGIPENINDPYQYLSDEMREESKEYFNTIFTEYNNTGSDTCLKDMC